jgi:hypothetical protein
MHNMSLFALLSATFLFACGSKSIEGDATGGSAGSTADGGKASGGKAGATTTASGGKSSGGGAASTGGAGTRPSTTGKSCGGIAGVACGSGEYCNFAASTNCGSGDQMGTCTAKPQMCTDIYAPVCGCDGATYASSCTAAGAGVSVKSDGSC